MAYEQMLRMVEGFESKGRPILESVLGPSEHILTERALQNTVPSVPSTLFYWPKSWRKRHEHFTLLVEMEIREEHCARLAHRIRTEFNKGRSSAEKLCGEPQDTVVAISDTRYSWLYVSVPRVSRPLGYSHGVVIGVPSRMEYEKGVARLGAPHWQHAFEWGHDVSGN